VFAALAGTLRNYYVIRIIIIIYIYCERMF